MKRRGFLGFMGGAVAAGPGMAKQAAAQTLADLSIVDGINPAPPLSYYGEFPPRQADWAIPRLGKFKELLKSAESLKRKHMKTPVPALDPDLANMRSISLGSKIRMQRDRNFKHWLENEGGWLQRAINGEEDY